MARKMPQNLEAEMSVLGVAFLNSYDVSKIVEEVTVDMFFDERNRCLFNAIKNLHSAKTPIDITTIKNELDKDKKLNTVGLDYITEVIDSVVTSANLDFYIKIIKDYAVRRNLINTATEIINKSYDEDDVTNLLDKAEQNILNVVRARTSTEFMPIHEVLRRAQERLEELAKNIIQVLIGCFSEDGEETEGWWKNVSKIDASIRLGSPFSENYFTSYDVPIVVARDAHDPEAIFDSWYSEYKDAEFQNSITPYVDWVMWELECI